jgi:hypothetical protein
MGAYIAYEDNSRLVIRCYDSSGRRSRGSQVAAVRRAWEKSNRVRGRLTRYCVTYDECPGFLSRTEVAYHVAYLPSVQS